MPVIFIESEKVYILPPLVNLSCVSRDLWEVIPEYLETLRVAGDLYLQVGVVKYARAYYKEGLTMAQMSALNTW